MIVLISVGASNISRPAIFTASVPNPTKPTPTRPPPRPRGPGRRYWGRWRERGGSLDLQCVGELREHHGVTENLGIAGLPVAAPAAERFAAEFVQPRTHRRPRFDIGRHNAAREHRDRLLSGDPLHCRRPGWRAWANEHQRIARHLERIAPNGILPATARSTADVDEAWIGLPFFAGLRVDLHNGGHGVAPVSVAFICLFASA